MANLIEDNWIQETLPDFSYSDKNRKVSFAVNFLSSNDTSKFWFPLGIENSYNRSLVNTNIFSEKVMNYTENKLSVCFNLLENLEKNYTSSDNGKYVFISLQGNIIFANKISVMISNYEVKGSKTELNYYISETEYPIDKDGFGKPQYKATFNDDILRVNRKKYSGVVYDYSNHKLTYYNNGELVSDYLSYPLAKISLNNDEDVVYNKMGSMGFVSFILPGVSLLVPGLQKERKNYILSNVYTSIEDDPFDIIAEALCKELGLILIQTEEGYLLDANDYLPKFLKESERMLSIMDLYNQLMTKSDTTVFGEIRGAYDDTIYKIKDYSKVSVASKLEIIHELGFDYILDIISLNDEQLTKLITFFNLIYMLKGKKEGLNLCLSLLNIPYSYVVWDETSPRGPRFTAKLTIVGNEYSDAFTFGKLKDFVRAYMLPWIDVIIEITNDVANLYAYPKWAGILRVIDAYRYNPSHLRLDYIKVRDVDSSKIKKVDDDIGLYTDTFDIFTTFEFRS